MGGQLSLEESIAKGAAKDPNDMDLVGEDSSQETQMGASSKTRLALSVFGPSFQN